MARSTGVGADAARRQAAFAYPSICSKTSQPLPEGSVTVRQGKANRRCTPGIDMRVHPHGFGLTRAYELMTEGVPLRIIQQQLGCASLPRLVW